MTQLLSLFDYRRIAQVVLGATIFECELLCISHMQLDSYNSLSAQALVLTHTVFAGSHYGNIFPITDELYIINVMH